MRLEDQAKKIALFFFFALLDERLAAQAAERAVGALKAAQGDAPARGGSAKETAKETDGRRARVRVVQLCKRRYDVEKAALPRIAAAAASSSSSSSPAGASAPGGEGSSWQVPADANMAAWIKFSKDAGDDERLAFAFARILKFSEEETAEGLSVSIGTLRHRLGRAARSLGVAVARTRAQ